MGINCGRVIGLVAVRRRWNGVHASLYRQSLHCNRIARRLRGRDGGCGGRRYNGRGRTRRVRLRRQRVARRRLRLLLLLYGARVRRRRRLCARAGYRRRSYGRDGRLKHWLLDLRTLHGLHDNWRLHGLSRGPRLNRRGASHTRRRAGRLSHRDGTRRAGRGAARVDPRRRTLSVVLRLRRALAVLHGDRVGRRGRYARHGVRGWQFGAARSRLVDAKRLELLRELLLHLRPVLHDHGRARGRRGRGRHGRRAARRRQRRRRRHALHELLHGRHHGRRGRTSRRRWGRWLGETGWRVLSAQLLVGKGRRVRRSRAVGPGTPCARVECGAPSKKVDLAF